MEKFLMQNKDILFGFGVIEDEAFGFLEASTGAGKVFASTTEGFAVCCSLAAFGCDVDKVGCCGMESSVDRRPLSLIRSFFSAGNNQGVSLVGDRISVVSFGGIANLLFSSLVLLPLEPSVSDLPAALNFTLCTASALLLFGRRFSSFSALLLLFSFVVLWLLPLLLTVVLALLVRISNLLALSLKSEFDFSEEEGSFSAKK
jgi:hypothetical protein